MSNDALALLVVEDSDFLHAFLLEGLEDAGFKLIMKSRGHDAIADLDANAARYKGVITDIRLGEGPSGWEIGRHARRIVPDIPVVYMSGDSGADWTSEGVPGSIMVQKPFVIAQIVTAITMLINDGAAAPS